MKIGSNGDINLIGAPSSSSYKGILFFVDRNAGSRSERLGGGGSMTLYGTIYTTNSKSNMGLTSSAPCSLNQRLFHWQFGVDHDDYRRNYHQHARHPRHRRNHNVAKSRFRLTTVAKSPS